ncbi:VCBS repeat-containing protein [Phaeobacter sp.]|uniref:FG-GAP repeat domain-containing protein n=1 Tax=Phaeobacter sp. TaxID=1902409 RepID=UPI0025EDF464|nr:VCBS repeat-containing protein [Phaeobacter sp.]
MAGRAMIWGIAGRMGGVAAIRPARTRRAHSLLPAYCGRFACAVALSLAGLGLSAQSSGAATNTSPVLVAAQYDDPTDHYPHGVLGDDIEYAALVAQDDRGQTYRVQLPEAGPVFEDLAPRLWDVTGDGAPEVVAIESDPRLGARLVIFALEGETLQEIAATPPIGTRFRWLAPIAAADLDGDGHIEIAYVDRPHLARQLRVWRYRAGALRQVASASGLTNHRIGEDFITSGLRSCAGAEELVLQNAGWTRVIGVRLQNGALQRRDLGPFDPDEGLAATLACRPSE